MKMGMKTTLLASALVLGLMTGTAMAQKATDATGSQDRMDGNMMMENGQGMMGGGAMMGHGMMGGKMMMGQGRMGCLNMMGQGMGGGMMGGGMMKNMSDGNQQKFMDATKEMRREMHNMHFDHMEAMRDPKTALKDLAAMEQKMLDLRKKMMDTAQKYQDQ
jgi:hypothetical protein